MDADALLSFLAFIPERHRVWEKRQAGEPGPWTDDPILATRKFTNVFRVLDPGSQYPLRALYRPELTGEEILARAWLYRHSNLPSAWPEEVPHLTEPGGPEAIREHWHEIRDRGEKWSSGAYILRPESVDGKHVVGGDKAEFFTRRCREIFQEGRWDIAYDFWRAETHLERIEILCRPEGVGTFMAQQIAVDVGYALGVDWENEDVVLGPGSTRGLAALGWGRATPAAIKHVAEIVWADPDCPTLGDRKPSLMDVQNTLCEFSKYVRGPVATTYRPAHPGPQPEPVLPSYYAGRVR